jgi:hypothetical protein
VSRLRRFLHIERSRAAGAADPADAAAGTAGRFGTVERPSAGPAPPPASGAELGRFGPEPPQALELLESSAGERPFTRCMRCGMDHGIFATECTGCGASLDTEPQREFNERLWARRQEEAAREARAAEERRARAAREEAEIASARRTPGGPERGGGSAAPTGSRAMGEEIAREVGRRERLRLDVELGWGGTGWDGAWRLLRRLLRRTPR